jgi:hypothetical protein
MRARNRAAQAIIAAAEAKQAQARLPPNPPNIVPVKQAPVKQVPAPVKQAPVKQAPVKQAPVKQAPVKQAPVKQAPVKRVPVKQAPIMQAPAEQDPVILNEEVAAEDPPVAIQQELPGLPQPVFPERSNPNTSQFLPNAIPNYMLPNSSLYQGLNVAYPNALNYPYGNPYVNPQRNSPVALTTPLTSRTASRVGTFDSRFLPSVYHSRYQPRGISATSPQLFEENAMPELELSLHTSITGRNTAYRIQESDKFSGSNKCVLRWITQFEHIVRAYGWDHTFLKLQLPLFLTGTASNMYEDLYLNGASWTDVKERFINEYSVYNTIDVVRQSLAKIKQSENESVASFYDRFSQAYYDAGVKVEEYDVVNWILDNIDPKFANYTASMGNMSFAQLRSALINMETRIDKNEARTKIPRTTGINSVSGNPANALEKPVTSTSENVNAPAVLAMSQERSSPSFTIGQPPQSHRSSSSYRDKSFGNGIKRCFICGKVGHIARYCRDPRSGNRRNGNYNHQTRSGNAPSNYVERRSSNA